MAESDRARLLAALEAVDCVVLFDEETPLELVRDLEPDVLVKGGDYAPDDIVGGDSVRSRGGRVLTVPMVPGYSTTSIVERLRASS
jgi:D-beta-D-heptose 7-phosphate kinase/D-beta-D-heptose 1-phosphate adenosyltransferase